MDTRSESRSLLVLWVLLMVVSGGLLAMDYIGWTRVLRRTADSLTVPAKLAVWQQTRDVQQWFGWWQYWQTGQAELLRLQWAIGGQANLVTKIGELQEENAILRKLLGAKLPAGWQFLPAQVIGRSGPFLTINQGSDQGAASGMMVISLLSELPQEVILLGKVDQAWPGQAQFKILAQPDIRMPVTIRDHQTGQQVGEGLLLWDNERLLIDKLLPDEKITVGNTVATGGEMEADNWQELWLPGIPVGVITEVNFAREIDIYQRARVGWLGDQQVPQRVFVITKW